MNLGEDMMRESQTWIATCGHCKQTHSIWDIGGIRYKAWGTVLRLTRCPHCRKTRFNIYAKKTGA
jgi:hypothetical protein